MKFISREYGYNTPAAAFSVPRPAVFTKSYGFPQTPRPPANAPASPAQRYILGFSHALHRNFFHPIYQTVRKDATADATPGGRHMALHVSGYQY